MEKEPLVRSFFFFFVIVLGVGETCACNVYPVNPTFI